MSDIEFSEDDSEPVSEVNPEEMAKLMADLDDIDDGLTKGKPKSAPPQKPDKDASRRVTFEKSSSASATKATKSDGDDDWDADDLLYSDEENRKGSQKKTSPLSGAVESAKTSKSPSRSTDAENSQSKNTSKSKLMADLFSDDSPNKESGKRNTGASPEGPKRDKSKLMSDLFGSSDAKNSSPKASPAAKARAPPKRPAAAKKPKDEVTFDDDDDLLGDIGDSKPKSRPVSGSPKSSGFMDSLLGKSSGVPKKEKSPEFFLDDNYKAKGKEKQEDLSFGGYMPSSGKSNSPNKRTSRRTEPSDPLDFLNEPEPRKKNPRSATQRKTFEVDDDDILGNIRSRRGRSGSEANQPQAGDSSAKSPSSSAKGKSDDWLFGSSDNSNMAAKKEMDNAAIEASVEPGNTAGSKTNTPNKSGDWLGSLLSSSKKSPNRQSKNTSNSPNVKASNSPQASVSPNITSAEANPTGVTFSPASAPHNTQGMEPQTALVTDQKEILMKQQLADAENNQLLMQMRAQQEQLLKQQQDMKLKAVSQMKAQQDQLEAQMAQQLLLQQQEVAKLQEASMKRYQDVMVPSVAGLSLNLPVQDSKSDETLKDLQIQLRSAEVDVARLTAELDLVRKHHGEEVGILEESYRKRQEMEREVWERTEQRLKEERDGLLSDFQAKIASLQAEKEALAASHEVQLVGVKNEWSRVVNRTKELYAEMAESMREEHSAALERMRYLKDLELNAAVSASGHVKEVEAVMVQLESNTANLSDLTASVNSRQDSALEITHRTLKLKEKQLKDFEAQIEASRAEAESERGRLNALISRLESTLIQQGSEVEKEKWRLTQEQMKTEMERKAMAEERRHLQISSQAERQNLATARESLLSEHKVMLQSIGQEKQELAIQRARLLSQQKIGPISSFNYAAKNSQFEADAEVNLLNEEHRRLREKMSQLIRQEKGLEEREEELEELRSELEKEKVKIALEKDYLEQEKKSLRKTQAEIDELRRSAESTREEQQGRLSQIAGQTQVLHSQQEKLDREQLRLDQKRDEVIRLVQQGQCPSCQSLGTSRSVLDSTMQQSYGRLPGDGGEGQMTLAKFEATSASNMSPAAVYARLVAARKHEEAEREKRLLQISALESS